MAEKKTYTRTGYRFKGMSIYKDDQGVYYTLADRTLYRLSIEPNALEDVQYDDQNPITEYNLEGTIDLLNPYA